MTNRGSITIGRETLVQLVTNAEQELTEGHLSVAMDIITSLLASLEGVALRSETREDTTYITENYARLLHIMGQGMQDPLRNRVYERLVEKAHGVLLDIRRAYDIATLKNTYTQWAEKMWGQKSWMAFIEGLDADNFEPGYTLDDYFFNLLWTSPRLQNEETVEIKMFLMTCQTRMQSYAMNAVTMSLLHYFDAAKVILLLEYSSSEDEDVRVRALLGLAIAIGLYADVIPLYGQLYTTLTSPDTFTPEMQATLCQLLCYVVLCSETERLEQRMEREILPALIKVSRQRIKLGFEDMSIDLSDPDSTPNISKKTRQKLVNGIHEMARLFHDGMDINLHTFSSLKSFPFFQHVCHWLAPFDPNRQDIPDIPGIERFPLCDNDKYSAALLLKQLPPSQFNQLRTFMEGLNSSFSPANDEKLNACQNVVQSFYRCLKRSPWTKLWPDIFGTLRLTDNTILSPLLQSNVEYLDRMGHILLHNKYYEQAEHHLYLLAQRKGCDRRLLLELGLCQQEQGKYARAIDSYRQAQMLGQEDDAHLLYRLQLCYARMGRYEEQLNYLTQLEQRNPDDVSVLTETGLCLMQLQRWQEAQKRFYKMEYHGQRVTPSQRAIAWCALRQKDYEQAARYYRRILENRQGVKWEDYLNAGHTAWLSGDIAAALPLYVAYARRYATGNPEVKDALEPFNQDSEVLTAHGKTATDIALMHDLIALRLREASTS